MRRALRRRGFTIVEMIIAFFIIGVLALLGFPNYMRSRAMSRLSTCESNLHNMSTALSLYANDNGGQYPTSLSGITPQHMVQLPSCPSSGTVAAYTTGYEYTNDAPTGFTISCNGAFHAEVGLGTGFPRIISSGGMQEH